MVLYLIGLGLSYANDITVRGLDIVRKCSVVYLENYTSMLSCSARELEELYGCEVVLCDREASEQKISSIVNLAVGKDVAFLVIGDPVSATTHMEIFKLCREKKVEVEIVNNASVFTAIGATGLQLYKFGKTTSIPFLERVPELETPYHIIAANKSIGAHTLCLLDIMVDNVAEETRKLVSGGKEIISRDGFGKREVSDNEVNYVESGSKSGNVAYGNNTKFMTVREALIVLLDIEKRLEDKVIGLDTKVIGVARLGGPDLKIKYGSVKELMEFDFGGPLHSVVVPGDLHFHEEEMLEMWK